MKKRYVWIVEMKSKRVWEPCADAALTRGDARRNIRHEWQDNNPHDKFRVCKYERVRK